MKIDQESRMAILQKHWRILDSCRFGFREFLSVRIHILRILYFPPDINTMHQKEICKPEKNVLLVGQGSILNKGGEVLPLSRNPWLLGLVFTLDQW